MHNKLWLLWREAVWNAKYAASWLLWPITRAYAELHYTGLYMIALFKWLNLKIGGQYGYAPKPPYKLSPVQYVEMARIVENALVVASLAQENLALAEESMALQARSLDMAERLYKDLQEQLKAKDKRISLLLETKSGGETA